nr:MAG TPA: hypothetical protein [Caudoviricetes sp.]
MSQGFTFGQLQITYFFNYHVHTKRNYKPLTRGAKGANSCEL